MAGTQDGERSWERRTRRFWAVCVAWTLLGCVLFGLVATVVALRAEPSSAPALLPMLGLFLVPAVAGVVHEAVYPLGYGVFGLWRSPAPPSETSWLKLEQYARTWRVLPSGIAHHSYWLGDFFVPFSRIKKVAPGSNPAHLVFVVTHDCPWLRKRLWVPQPVADMVSALIDGELTRAAELAAAGGNPSHLERPLHSVRGSPRRLTRWRVALWILGPALLVSLYLTSAWIGRQAELDWLRAGPALTLLAVTTCLGMFGGDALLAHLDRLRQTQTLLYPDRLFVMRPSGGVALRPEQVAGYSVWGFGVFAVHALPAQGRSRTRLLVAFGEQDHAAVCDWFDQRQLPRLEWGPLRVLLGGRGAPRAS